MTEASGIPPGSPQWGTWYLPMNRALAVEERTAGRDPTGEWTQFEAAIRQLVGEMGKPSPNSGKVREFAGSALKPLDGRLAAASSRVFSASDVERVVTTFQDADSWKNVGSWDHAAQRYLGFVPFRQAWISLDPGHQGQETLKRELDELRKRLKFDDTLNSPRRGFVPTTLRDGH